MRSGVEVEGPFVKPGVDSHSLHRSFSLEATHVPTSLVDV